MKKIIVKSNETKEFYIFNNSKFDFIFDVLENAKLVVYQYVVNTSGKVCVNLQENGAIVEYHYSSINYDDNNFKFLVNHNASNTTSNVYNYGINVNNKILMYEVTGKVLKTSEGCIVNQKNQIINLNDGESGILPNLLINNYNVSSSHAAYIGKFKEELIFYLMSRGITRKKSIELLIRSLLLNNGDTNNSVVKEFLQKIEEI